MCTGHALNDSPPARGLLGVHSSLPRRPDQPCFTDRKTEAQRGYYLPKLTQPSVERPVHEAHTLDHHTVSQFQAGGTETSGMVYR